MNYREKIIEVLSDKDNITATCQYAMFINSVVRVAGHLAMNICLDDYQEPDQLNAMRVKEVFDGKGSFIAFMFYKSLADFITWLLKQSAGENWYLYEQIKRAFIESQNMKEEDENETECDHEAESGTE